MSFQTVGDLLTQIRTLLQDVDSPTLGGYRYSTDSLVSALNMGLLEMFRIRPDIFLAASFVVPQYDASALDTEVAVEQQWMPSLIYYTVGMAQIRDDEGTQDTRASAFLSKFTSMLVTLA